MDKHFFQFDPLPWTDFNDFDPPTWIPSPPIPSLPAADPGFAERAAKFSCFGSRSFNGRSAAATPLMKLHRVASSPALKPDGSPAANSNDESSVSQQNLSGNEMNSRKRRGKTKEDGSNTSSKGENGNGKRCKKKEEEKAGEAPKDYIHVRARRGQATDSHSLAERVRREKISERMKLLQDLVPGCNKVTGKALMLDEIINYVQSLQRQVQFLSMKLASVNPELDETIPSKDVNFTAQFCTAQDPNSSFQASGFYQHQSVPLTHNPVIHGFYDTLHQLPEFSEDDLHSIFQMGFAVQNEASNMKVEL